MPPPAPREIELGDVWRPVRRRWWLVAATVVLLVGFAAASSVLSEDRYRAEAEVLVGRPGEGRGDAVLNRELADQAEIAEGSAVVADATEELGYEPDVDAEARRESDLIVIAVRSEDPDAAAEAANAVADAYVERRRSGAADEGEVTPAAAVAQVSGLVEPRRADIEARIAEIDASIPSGGALDPALAEERDALAAELDELDGIDEALTDAQLGLTVLGSGADVTTRAEPPSIPESGGTLRNVAVAGVLGAILGALLALAVDRMVDTIGDEADAELVSGGLRVLGAVPRHPSLASAPGLAPSGSAVVEVHRGIGAALSTDEPSVVLLTSPDAGAGKTTTAANLAAALARTGARALAMDADLRRPGLARAIGVESTGGLAAALDGRALDELLVTAPGVPSLSVLPAGQAGPEAVERLGAPEARSLLRSLGERFGVVVVDTPPVNLTSDALYLSAAADAVVLVVRARHTKRKAVRKALGRLDQVGVEVRGVVVTDVREATEDLYYPASAREPTPV